MTNPQVRRINNYLRRQGSPYAGRGEMFVRKGRKYGVDPNLLIAIANAETSIGKAGRGPSMNNPYGLGGVKNMMSFGSLGAATDYEARLLRRDYLGQGLTSPLSISAKYVHGNQTPARDWSNTVSTTLRALGSDPQHLRPGGPQTTPRKPAGAQSRTRAARTITNAPEIMAERAHAQDDFFTSLIRASQARQQGQPSQGGEVLSSLEALREAEQRQPTVKTIPGFKPSKASKQANSGKKQFASKDGTILGGKYTPGGGPDAHGSRPLGNWQSDHAWDLMAPAGTPVYALVDGVIDPNAGFGFRTNGSTVWGRRLTLRGEGNAFFYTHLGKYAKGIKPGARVKKGQLIGFLGQPPSFPSHLHIGLLHGDLSDYVS